MALNLITTKLMVPRPPQSVVERPRLLQKLHSGLNKKLILVSAPAGSGKSTLLASWLKSLNCPTAWLSLDGGDDEPDRFLLYLVSALQQVDPRLGEGLPDLLQTRTVEVEPLIIQIINDVAQHTQEFLLVLDDYHLISNPKIHDGVEFLLDHLPPGLCLVLATRTDPPLALPRLRVRRQLVEIRADDLRFGLEETHAFLNEQLNLGLSPSAIAMLEDRTEGWVAGLQLAALSLSGRKDKEAFVEGFAGSHHYLVDYLMDEVLTRQTPQMRQFLQRTSILERFTLPLCQAVTDQSVSAELLQQLEAANLFLIPLDDQLQWYRFHHLFAEFLQHRLRSNEAEQIPELHRRASEWLEQEGWTDEAIQHALAANDFARAARLVEGSPPLHPQVMRYMDRLPRELLLDHPTMLVTWAWGALLLGQRSRGSDLKILLEQSQARKPRAEVAATLLSFRGADCLGRLDFAGAEGFFKEALVLLEPLVQPQVVSHEGRVLSRIRNFVPYTYLLSGEVKAAVQEYGAALELSKQQALLGGIANCSARLGRGHHLLGQLKAAMTVLQQGLESLAGWSPADGHPSPRVINTAEHHLNLSRLHYEWNQLEQAQQHLEQARPILELHPFRPSMAAELELTCLLYLSRGQTEAAAVALGKLDRLSAGVAEVHKLSFEARAMNLRLQLADVQTHLLDEVGSWVEARHLKADHAFSYPNEGSYFVLARWLVAQHKASQALPLLERLIQAAEAGERVDDLIRYRTLQVLAHQSLQVLAHQSLGQGRVALEVLQSTLNLAGPEGYCRSFLDLGRPMQALIEQLAQQHPTPYLLKLLQAFPSGPSPTLQPAPEPSIKAAPLPKDKPEATWLEPLSEREQTILQLLSGGSSNKEISTDLALSPNTVKWYIKSLFGKLGVENRLEATNRARELGLL